MSDHAIFGVAGYVLAASLTLTYIVSSVRIIIDDRTLFIPAIILAIIWPAFWTALILGHLHDD